MDIGRILPTEAAAMHEWFIENLFQHRKKVIYALKEITAGDQFEIEIYPQFRSMDEVPPEGRTIKKDNNKAQKNLNDKNARKYVERLINENFSDRDIWMTLTYDDEHLPPDGDVDAAMAGMTVLENDVISVVHVPSDSGNHVSVLFCNLHCIK